MRIGELLLESEIVNAKQLADALHYARAKELPLGRCLKILRLLTEHDLERALETQKLIRNGLDAKVGAQILNIAVKHGLSVRQALMERSKFMHIKVDPQKAAAPEIEDEQEKTKAPIKPTKSAFQFIQDGDRLFGEEKIHEAEKRYIDAREQLLKEHGHECTEIAAVQVKIANLYMATDRFDEAEHLYSDVLQSYTHLRGPEDPLVAKSFEDLGDLNQVRGRPGPAQDYLARALEIAKKQKPIDITVAARLLKKLAAVTESSKESRRKKLGEFCLDGGLLMNSEIQYALKQARAQVKPIGAVLRDEKFLQPDQIESLMLAQLLTKKGILPYDIAVQALALSHKTGVHIKYICDIGRIGVDSGEDTQHYKQLVLEQDNLLTAERLLGPYHYEVAVIAERLADLYARHSDVASAIVFYKQAQTVLERAQRGPGDNKQRVATVMLKYARMLAKEDRAMEAEPIFMQALEIIQSSGKGESLEAAECLHELALIHKAQHNLPSALSFMNTAAALFEKLNMDQAALPVLEEMVQIQMGNNMFTEAETTLNRLVGWAQRQYGPFEPETAVFMEQLGDLYQLMGRPHQAHSQYHFAMQIYERTKGCEHKFKQLDDKLTASRGM
jgi:tetratricopeptide (TPR) repeat protein